MEDNILKIIKESFNQIYNKQVQTYDEKIEIDK